MAFPDMHPRIESALGHPIPAEHSVHGLAALPANSLDNMALAGLWSALGGTTEADLEGEKHLLAHTQERWVFELPQDFVHRLAALQSDATAEVAMSWAKHEELAHMGADGPGIEPVVEAMSGFARQAIGQGKSLLLFMCI